MFFILHRAVIFSVLQGVIFSILQWGGVMFSIRQGGHVLQTLFPTPSDWGDLAPTVSALLLVACFWVKSAVAYPGLWSEGPNCSFLRYLTANAFC